METLIVHPDTKEQLAAIKAVLKALKVNFDKKESPYNSEFIKTMKEAEEDVKAGRTTEIKPADIWNLE